MLNDAQRRLQEQLFFTQANVLKKDQAASTNLKRTVLNPSTNVITKMALYDSPYSDLELANKTIISYPTSLTRDYMTEFNYCNQWKIFGHEDVFRITKATIEVYINRLKVWYKDIEFRVRRDQFFIIIPKVENIHNITVFEIPEAPRDLRYQTNGNIVFPTDWYAGEYPTHPVGYGKDGKYNHIGFPPGYALDADNHEEEWNQYFWNNDWDGNEFEVTFNRVKTHMPYCNDLIKSTDSKFKYQSALSLFDVAIDPKSIKIFNKDRELMYQDEYSLELVLKGAGNEYAEGQYTYIFRYNKPGFFYFLAYNTKFSQLTQFKLDNIVTRFDHFHDYINSFNDYTDQSLIPQFIRNFKNLEFLASDLAGTADETFFRCMSRAISHNPENYSKYLDTLAINRKYVEVKELDPSWLCKTSNRAEIESRFQALDFIGEHVMLTIRNPDRNENIGIYFNGLKYVGIRNMLHARNFTYIYILKDALPEKIDIATSYFEIEIKPESYASFNHSSRFDGDALLLIDKDNPDFISFNGNVNELKFFINGKCIRRGEVLYAKDLVGNHSFFFNIKTYKGDTLSIEYSEQVFKEINYLTSLPNNGVLSINKTPIYKYPLSTKYYEIYINGRRMAFNNELFVSNFIIQFKLIKGNHNIVIYEKSDIDASQLNTLFNNTSDEWDKFVRTKNISTYIKENVIVPDIKYNLNVYTPAQYRMHLLFWWLLVPKNVIMESNPSSTPSAIFTEIMARFPDFVNGKKEVILDAHTKQTSIMMVGNEYVGKVKNAEYIIDNIMMVSPPTDSNESQHLPDLPCGVFRNNVVRMDTHINGLSGLRMVPNTVFKPKE